MFNLILKFKKILTLFNAKFDYKKANTDITMEISELIYQVKIAGSIWNLYFLWTWDGLLIKFRKIFDNLSICLI